MMLLEKLAPNILSKPDEFLESCLQTLYMVLFSGGIAFVIGLAFGVILTVTRKGGILQNTAVYAVLDKAINLFRSIPFVILLTALIPVTRFVVGTAIGTKGAVLPLVAGTIPFYSRQVENALVQLDHGLVEAAESMGSGPFEIIFRIYLRESLPALSRATTVTLISLIGLTAMAGAVGGGGLGDFAVRYGHQRNQADVTYVTVIVLLAAVSLVQTIGLWLERRTTL